MYLLVLLVCVLALTAALVVTLAWVWSHTPHGRLKPIFALVFRLAPLLDRQSSGRAIGAQHMETPAERTAARAKFLEATAPLSAPFAFDGTVADRRLPDAPGGDLPVRIYTPAGNGPFPLIVYFHGGGFVVGSPAYTDVAGRILAARTPAIVVSVDYRLAPEHRAPAAADDCAFAVGWCFENAGALGARPGPLVVAGDSAGGNLAAVVAQRDATSAPRQIALQVLIYPTVDLARSDRPSQIAFGEGYGLSRLDLDDCIRHYLPAGMERTDPAVSPLHAPSRAGLPPAFIITAGFDILRDEGAAYAEALRAAGVDVTYVNESAMPHGYITMTRLCSEAEKSLEAIASAVRASTGAAPA